MYFLTTARSSLSLSCFFISIGFLASCATSQNSENAGLDNSQGQKLNNAFNLDAAVLPTCETDDVEYLESRNTVWEVLRKDFAFSKGVENSRVGRHLAIYDRRRKYFNTINERAQRYLYHVAKEVKKREMPAELALLPVIESGLDPFAYSHGRAAGMWQFIPSTARIFDLESNWWYEGRRDVKESTRAALDYLQRLEKRFDGDWMLALAAYNSGSGTVYRAIRENKRRGLATDYWSLTLPRETMDYVPKLIALAQVVDKPDQYGIELAEIPFAPYFDEVDAQGQIDLSQAADLAEVSTDHMYLLNPGFNRWATDPEKNRKLLVPYEHKYVFMENLSKLKHEDRLAWTRYTIKSGDTLSEIARKHHINTEFLKSVNNLTGHQIRIGQTLMIPKPILKTSAYSLTQEQRKQALSHRNYSGKSLVKYKVKENDSFWSIGKRYNVGIRTLAKWNGMAPGDTLRQGQLLNIWVNNNISERKVYRKVYYTVRTGDSLSRIASRFRVTVSDIQRWNKLHNQKYLFPGQQLVLNVNVAK